MKQLKSRRGSSTPWRIVACRSLSVISFGAVCAMGIPGGLVFAEDMDKEQSEIVSGDPGAGTAASNLFQQVGVGVAATSADQTQKLDNIQNEPTTKGVRVVRIDVDALRKPTVRLNLASDKSILVTKATTEPRDDNNFDWFGELPDVPGNAVLAVHGDNVTGSVNTGTSLYSIRPLGNGLHAVIEVDQTKFPEDHPPEFQRIEDNHAKDTKGDVEPQGQLAPADAQIRTIKVLVAYTPAVNSAVADVDGLIQLAIAETNLSYRNSNINLRVDLAHSYEASYTESGNFSTDLARFRGTSDGQMDDVHSRRRQHGADMAVLLINDGSYCGLASGIGSSKATAFAAVYHGCATGYYSFAHELGHLQSARHNPEADSTTTPFAFGHGYYNQANSWRTVMSYNCPGNCTRLPYWSNPNVDYNGDAMGSAATHYNARALNQTAVTVASFEGEHPVGARGYAWANDPSSANYSPSASYSYNSSGDDIRVTRSGTGRYAVRFDGLGGNGTAGGNVQVTGYGSDANNCKVSGWSSSSANFVANVRCYNHAGALADARYSVQVTWP